mmetsp:Transcript_23847/g.49398  ORF Transcript_23847/g.49398 Transcript_23847/m.49398 type:complete len:765 (-) Transcript_23847:1499-3793(-)
MPAGNASGVCPARYEAYNDNNRRVNSILPAVVLIVIFVAITSFAVTYVNLESSRSLWYQYPKTISDSENFSSPRRPKDNDNNIIRGDRTKDNPPSDGGKKSSYKERNFQSNINRIGSNGLHVCTCLTPNNPSNKYLPGTPKSIRWLHFPKTGTSFISTLWSYACSTRERYIDLAINSHQCSIFDRSSFSMYDFALMKRYPWELYGAPNFIPSSKSKVKDDGSMKDLPLPLVAGTQHQPLINSMRDFKAPSSDRIARLQKKKQLRNFGSEFEHNITVAAIFRQPEQRIISAFYDSRHANGFDAATFKNLIEQTSGPRAQGKPACQLPDGKIYHNHLECFARFPGIAGCMARMLTGEKCADGLFQESGFANVAEAVDIIMNQLDFVGLTEEWNESICQFHRLYAGKLDKVSGELNWIPPQQGEFANVHASKNKKVFGLEHLHGFKDVADAVVYEAAKLKFERIVGSERCYKFMSWDELEEEAWNPAAVPFIKLDRESNLCHPKSCADLNKQCGEWPDGCGNTVICGLCNRGRTGLPSTWRTQCIEGRCVDYCPPWDERGYWFTSDLEKNPPSLIKNANLPFLKQQNQQYLTPHEAIRTCVMLCSNTDSPSSTSEIDNSLRDELCSCGTTPTQFLRSNWTLEDFSSAHDLDANCAKSKARLALTLSINDTQPICCPYYNQTTPRPKMWKRMFFMMQKSYEGEYFAHTAIGCGGFDECETFARQNGADMAVFEIYNSMCYAMRNVFDLETSYSVTKDNQERYFFDFRA